MTRRFPSLAYGERWRNRAGEAIETCTILTTRPNSVVADVHDRMPVILQAEHYDLWLDPGVTDPSCIADCLKPYAPKLMKRYPVGPRVNRVENDDEDCAREVPIASAPADIILNLVTRALFKSWATFH